MPYGTIKLRLVIKFENQNNNSYFRKFVLNN